MECTGGNYGLSGSEREYAKIESKTTNKDHPWLPALDSTRFLMCVFGHFDQMYCPKTKYSHLFFVYLHNYWTTKASNEKDAESALSEIIFIMTWTLCMQWTFGVWVLAFIRTFTLWGTVPHPGYNEVISEWKGNIEKNLSIEYGFPSITRFMGILCIHLMIYLPECACLFELNTRSPIYCSDIT